jgi:WD40-like Beta Propeller Repeat
VRKKLAALVVAAFAAAVLAAPGETIASPGTAPLAGIDDAARCRSYLAYGRITAPGRCNYATSAQMMRSLLTRDRAPFDALTANRDPNQRWATAASNELAVATVASTTRVSVGGAGNEANDHSCCPSMSADGRHVAFESYATNLVATDTNNRLDIFVRDTSLATTTRASLDSGGNQANDDSYFPVVSADGRFVAFVSFAGNLVAGDTVICGPPEFQFSCIDVFVRDLQTGTTEMISVSSAEVPGNDFSYVAAISADGRYVAFFSYATNLVPGDFNNSL